MKKADGAFMQAYNAQAAVDAAHQIIVSATVTAQAADAPHLVPVASAIAKNTGRAPRRLSADAGYYSEDAVTALVAQGIDPYIASDKVKHGQAIPPVPRGRIPAALSAKARMQRSCAPRLGTPCIRCARRSSSRSSDRSKRPGIYPLRLRGLTKSAASGRS